MVQTKPKFYSFADYLAYDDGTERLYELFNGELIEVPPESGYNTSIAFFLSLQFVAQVGHLRVRPHGLELEVRGEPKNRYPDLTILQPEHIQLLASRNTIRLSMPPPPSSSAGSTTAPGPGSRSAAIRWSRSEPPSPAPAPAACWPTTLRPSRPFSASRACRCTSATPAACRVSWMRCSAPCRVTAITTPTSSGRPWSV